MLEASPVGAWASALLSPVGGSGPRPYMYTIHAFDCVFVCVNLCMCGGGGGKLRGDEGEE